ncbi:N-alpha-acetyltransferase 80 [Arctopsyche grandis]|uniref:N-alpha-acetyltransferase 80 n=1 Tax=Arctopsyche grandis TaxID=121162 RepID=UPI00406DA011
MTDLDESALSVVALHQHPELMKQCCILVNEEWPRSETARMLSLQTSCDKMPTCLVLLTGDKKVIGHCKLTPIPSIKDSCFVESVVIDKALRGKRMGTFLMQASEEYCRLVLNLKTIHLSTKGQEIFYQKLGYNICEPISIYGSFPQAQNAVNNIAQINIPKLKIDDKLNTNTAPPIPPPLNIKMNVEPKKTAKTYMVKSLLL